LRELVHSLKREDFLSLGRDALTRVCEENDTLCTDERHLFIDLIASEGSPEAQAMTLEFVMKHPEATEEDMRRCLFHAIVIADPVMVKLVYYIGIAVLNVCVSKYNCQSSDCLRYHNITPM